jgi:ribose-phosphate pyrophosphokinase
MMAKIIKSVGVDRVITFSLHAPQSSAAFFAAGLKFDNISTAQVFLPDIKEMHKTEDFVIVSPDAGGLSKARYYAKVLDTDIAFADKRRGPDRKSEVMNLVGDVKGRNIFIVDDMIDKGGTIINVINALKEKGALNIYCIATHLVLSEGAAEKLQNTCIKRIYGSNSIIHNNLPDKFVIKSLGSILSKVISKIHSDESVGDVLEESSS